MLSRPILQQKGGSQLDILISVMVSVVAGIICNYICKWLDRNDEDN